MLLEDATNSQGFAVAVAFAGGADADYSPASDAVLIGTAGNLKVDMAGTGTGLTLALAAGIHRLRITKIYNTGTTAAGVFVLRSK